MHDIIATLWNKRDINLPSPWKDSCCVAKLIQNFIISGFTPYLRALTNSWQYGIHRRYSTPSTITIHAYAQTSFRLLTRKNVYTKTVSKAIPSNHSIKERLSSSDLFIISLLALPIVTFLSIKFQYGITLQTTYSLSFYTFKPLVSNLPLFLLMNT